MKHQKYHLLVVEDSPTQAFQLKFILEREGYRVTAASDGLQGLEMARNISPDLVISDVMMPEMDGYAMCAAMKADPSIQQTPVMLLTTLSNSEDLMLGLKAKADYYLTKPYDEAYLLSRVTQILEEPILFTSEADHAPIEIVFAGKRHRIESNQRRVLNLLMSTYENAVQRNLELIKAQEELKSLNQTLAGNVQELSASEGRFRSLVMTIPDIVYRIDAHGTFVFVNSAIKRLGYDPEDIVGQHFSSIIAPGDIERVSRDNMLKHYRNRVTGDDAAPKLFDERRAGVRKSDGLEVRLLPKHHSSLTDGVIEPLGDEMVAVEVNSSGLYQRRPDTQQEIFIGTVGVIRDITVRRQIETSLKESEERLKTILNYTEAGIMVIDTQTHLIVDVNPAATKMIGLPTSEIIGSNCCHHICPAGKDNCPARNLQSVSESKENYLVNAKGQKVSILKTIAPIVLDGRKHILETFVDIRKLKQTEQALKDSRDNMEHKVRERTVELRNSQARLVQVEKISALGTMTAGIAHELNNPMMGMMNFIEYCLKHTEKDSKVHTVLEDARNETKRCVDIVKNLLTFSRIKNEGEENPVLVELPTILERIFRLLSYRIKKENVNLVKKYDPQTPPVWIKSSNMQQVFLNLIGNSLDALKDVPEKTLQVAVEKKGQRVNVSVTDNGTGIQKNLLSKIFDPFFTTKPVGKGTGLGLSISRSIVEDHNGNISCESIPGKETTFKVRLPLD